MCLHITKEIPTPEAAWPRTYYKVYGVGRNLGQNGKILFSAILNRKVESPGIVESDRFSKIMTDEESDFNCIERGIHVFTTYEAAHKYSLPSEKVVPVICREEDLVAFGKRDQAVFMKVEIIEAEWERI